MKSIRPHDWPDFELNGMLKRAQERADHENARADAAWREAVKRFNGDFRSPPKMALADGIGYALIPFLIIGACVWVWAMWPLWSGQ